MKHARPKASMENEGKKLAWATRFIGKASTGALGLTGVCKWGDHVYSNHGFKGGMQRFRER
jgi:hypothetical protein